VSNRKIAMLALLVAQAIILSFIERLIPTSFAVPGIKLGLANIITLIALYMFSVREAFLILVIRILLTSLLFGSITSLLYSAFGGLLSFLIMALFIKYARNKFSVVGISVAGGVFHNIGQIAAASIMVQNFKIVFYLPVLMISGVITGIFIGLIGKYLMKYMDRVR